MGWAHDRVVVESGFGVELDLDVTLLIDSVILAMV